MGIFKQSPAERKLEELTGHSTLSEEFKALLRANNIDLATGNQIKRQLKEEIKLDIVSAEGLETRIRYLIKKHANTEVKEEPVQKDIKEFDSNSPGLKAYGDKINKLKEEYDEKEKNVKELIEKRFSPPQITYDKFMTAVKKCNGVFNSQYESASNIINLASQETPKIDMELETKISALESITKYIDDLTNELLINMNSKSNKDIEGLYEDMEDLIDSVKDYE